MVSAFRGVIALAADDAIAAFATPEPTTGLNDAPSNGPLGAAWCVSAFMSGTDRRRAALRPKGRPIAVNLVFDAEVASSFGRSPTG